MTNLEAKEKLYNEWQKFLENNLDYAGISEAYKMAFKALELEPCADAISRQAAIEALQEVSEHYTEKGREWHPHVNFMVDAIKELPSVTPQPKIAQPKIGRWVYRIYGGFHEQGDWYCSHCDYQYNYGNGHAKFCPECGYEMSEPSTEEKVRDKDYNWIIRR